MSMVACFKYLRRITRHGRYVNVYFVSTNLVLPFLVLFLEAICAPGCWCFDMHDDLLYSMRGAARVRAYVTQLVLLRTFDLIVHAAPTLQELFPNSRHLGNASSMMPVHRSTLEYTRVLILASIDERMDFSLLDECASACPNVTFDIYGQVNSAASPALQKLIESRPNIHHYGAYVLTDLVSILERYAVMLAPYRTGTRITRYIDPLRFYHALNSGMEIISTDIPQAQVFKSRLHIVCSAQEFACLLESLRRGEVSRKNSTGKPLVTWDQRAAKLIAILMTTQRIQKLSSETR
jgi:hypothetical protein